MTVRDRSRRRHGRARVDALGLGGRRDGAVDLADVGRGVGFAAAFDQDVPLVSNVSGRA